MVFDRPNQSLLDVDLNSVDDEGGWIDGVEPLLENVEARIGTTVEFNRFVPTLAYRKELEGHGYVTAEGIQTGQGAIIAVIR